MVAYKKDRAKLFKPLEKSNIINENVSNRKTTEKLLNEILSTVKQENKNRIENFIEEINIVRG